MPLLRRASIKRLAAMAAPPILSDVFIISTLMLCKVSAKVEFFILIKSFNFDILRNREIVLLGSKAVMICFMKR